MRVEKNRRPSPLALVVAILAIRIGHDQERVSESEERTRGRPVKQELDATAIQGLLDEVNRFENGPSYRIFVWAPMLLQFAKLLIVRGAPVARLLGLAFFASWLLVDGLLVISSLRPLTRRETDHVIHIVQMYGPSFQRQVRSFRWFISATQFALGVTQIALFGTGGWHNITTISSQRFITLKRLFNVLASFVVALVCFGESLLVLEFGTAILSRRKIYMRQKIFSEGFHANLAISNWILLLLSFMGLHPMQSFHPIEQTSQPS